MLRLVCLIFYRHAMLLSEIVSRFGKMSATNSHEEHVRYISLVRREGGEPIVGITYREMTVDPDLVASFVLAVIIFENRQLRRFVKEGYVVVIEEGEQMVGLLIIDKVEDEDPYREALKNIIATFETKYGPQLENWKGDVRPFREFALYILGVYPYRRFEWELVPRLSKKSDSASEGYVPIPWSVGEADRKIQTVVSFINGKRTMLEIAQSTGLSKEEIAAIVSVLDHFGWTTFGRRITERTFLVKLSDPHKFLVGVYGEQINRFVELCDGTRNLKDVTALLPYSMEVLLTVAKNLVDAGVLGFLEAGL